jgi:hypothetical protein
VSHDGYIDKSQTCITQHRTQGSQTEIHSDAQAAIARVSHTGIGPGLDRKIGVVKAVKDRWPGGQGGERGSSAVQAIQDCR